MKDCSKPEAAKVCIFSKLISEHVFVPEDIISGNSADDSLEMF